MEYQSRLKELFARINSAGQSSGEQPQKPKQGIPLGAKILVLLASILAAGWLILRSREGFRRRLVRALRKIFARPGDSAVITGYYRDALDMLQARGYRRVSNQTPLEFAQSLGAHPAAKPLKALTHLYNQVRFGAQGIGERISEAEALLQSLQDSLEP